MSNRTKFFISLALGFVAYQAYNTLKRTQTTMVTTPEPQYNSAVMDYSTIAGLNG